MTTTLVTGANRGIGLELCRKLAARGDEVIAICRQASEDLAGLTGVRVEAGIDLTAGDAPAEVVKRLGGRKLDLVVHNAGVLSREGLDALDVDAVRKQFEVNALAPLRLTAALAPSIARGGKLVLVTSRMGSLADNGSGGFYGYRMSKAALNMAGVSLAHDLRAQGVAVLIVHPGYVKTRMTGHNGDVTPEQSAARIVQRIDELSLETTGRFVHANGEVLPW
jgi:NAD(P)-dependent dehydrogenase (short-subunit alcohol dehydrogenase family)